MCDLSSFHVIFSKRTLTKAAYFQRPTVIPTPNVCMDDILAVLIGGN